MPNLSDLSNLDDNKEPEVKAKELPKLPTMSEQYTYEDVKKHWLLFAHKIDKQGKYNISTILKSNDMSLEKDTIILNLHNELQKGMINEIKEELMFHIRKGVRNTSVMIRTILVEQKQGRRLYTTQEKYDFLEEKFPAIKDLKKRLGLEIGF